MARTKAAKQVDWAAIEKDWLPGLMPISHISQKHKISRAAIIKHFDNLGMKRDLKAQIMAKAETLVSSALVTQHVTLETKISDKELIEAGAVDVARVLVGQRSIIQRHAKLAHTLLCELEGVTDLREDFEHLGELLYAPDEKGVDKLNEIYRKVMAIPGRVDAFKKLSDTLKVLIALERQAVGLSDNSNGEANKPPAEEAGATEITNDTARRIAFILTSAERSKKA